MNPRHLRAKTRITLGDMAIKLSTPPGNLRLLEDMEVGLWDVQTLRAYVRACGYELRMAAVKDGREERVD